jgi:2,4-diaminopentanoate dehydrogenase
MAQSTPDRRKLRVVQWATGNVGLEALRAILDHPALELAGVLVYSDEKHGVDAGTLCGRDEVGVRATKNPSEILALSADCVCYTPRRAQLDEVCRLLESGKNVVATPFLFYPPHLPEADRKKLEGACAKGESSVHGTGINPGFIGEVLPLVLSGMSRRIERLHVQERANWSLYASPHITFDNMRFGHPAEAATLEANAFAKFNSGIFEEQVHMLADGLGAPLDDLRVTQELIPASTDFEITGGTVKRGTVSGQRYRWEGIVHGRSAIEIEALWTVGADYPESWPRPKDGWTITIEGDPSFKVHFMPAATFDRTRRATIDEHVHSADIATAMQAVNAIQAVCDAPAGIRTFLDLPLIRGAAALRT